MSRVERTENPGESRASQQRRQAQRGRRGSTPQGEVSPDRKPSKAEGEVKDVEEALRNQEE
jgi:hypothetical protein